MCKQDAITGVHPEYRILDQKIDVSPLLFNDAVQNAYCLLA